MVTIHELLVAGSGLLAGLSTGSALNYPSILIHQLSSNESSIELDWETSSWVGSIYGIAGLPSILMPTLMQWKGRKPVFILVCLFSIIGWIITCTATTITSILISECLNGFGSQSIWMIGLLSMGEMLSPSIRNVTLSLFVVMETVGMALVAILGSYLHWRTVALVECLPIILTALAASMWPESPSWLAYKGKFNKCTKAFILLRGNGEVAQAELKELILAQKENLSRENKKQSLLKYFWETLTSKDFYLPGIHMFASMYSLYWTGELVVLIYSSDIIQRATHSKDTVVFGKVLINIALLLGCTTSTVLSRYCRPKLALFVCTIWAVVNLLCASGVSYFQSAGLIAKESYTCLYIITLFVYAISTSAPIAVSITSELMPVKHRGIGGPLFGLIACVLHTSSMKLSPYLLKYINLWGTFLFFAFNGFMSGLYVWIYVPETKGRTLQQLEDYYNYGNMEKRRDADIKDLHELMTIKE